MRHLAAAAAVLLALAGGAPAQYTERNYVVLGTARGFNPSVSGDTSFIVPGQISKYAINYVAVQCAADPGAAKFGIFTAASAGGNAIVAAATALSGSVSPAFVNPSLTGFGSGTALTLGTLYLNVGTTGNSTTCNLWVLGFDLS